jgi:hypothetical protein
MFEARENLREFIELFLQKNSALVGPTNRGSAIPLSQTTQFAKPCKLVQNNSRQALTRKIKKLS